MRRAAALGTLLCLGAVACRTPDPDAPPAPTAATPVRVERTVYLMGTLATLVADAPDRAAGVRRLDRMVRVIEATEAELSTWRDATALGALNRQPIGVPWTAPPALCDLLGQVAVWHRETGGAFDPAVGPLVEAWGLRAGGRQPDAATRAAAAARSGLRHLVLDGCAVTRRVDVTLDAGGFGKGAALARLGAAVDGPGFWLVDFGGQVAVSGPAADGGGWPVALAHPLDRGRVALELTLDGGSVATSGGSERDVVVDGGRIGHILDPRTGAPVSRPVSVAVWHADPLAADILSTALYVMGVDAGLAWAEPREVAAVFLEADTPTAPATLRATPAFTRRFPAAAP